MSLLNSLDLLRSLCYICKCMYVYDLSHAIFCLGERLATPWLAFLWPINILWHFKDTLETLKTKHIKIFYIPLPTSKYIFVLNEKNKEALS